MSEPDKDNCDELWRQLVEAESRFYAAGNLVLTSCRNQLVELIRPALLRPHQTVTALRMAKFLTIEERQSLLPDLLGIACSYHGQTAFARELVLDLPHEWLINNIEASAERLLQYNSYEEYQGLFQIYMELDLTLAKKLTERAARHSDPDIQDASDHFLEALRQEGEL